MKRLIALGALAVILLSAQTADGAHYPRHFGFKIFVAFNRAAARQECEYRDKEQEGDDLSRCVSYAAECRPFSGGRIECLAGEVEEFISSIGAEPLYLEKVGFTLWYPPLKNGGPRRQSPRVAQLGAPAHYIEGPRCQVRAKPYECNGPWGWPQKPDRDWHGPGCGGCGYSYPAPPPKLMTKEELGDRAGTALVVFGSGHGTDQAEPRTVYASSSANGPFAKGLNWSEWGQAEAHGRGTLYYRGTDGYQPASGEVLLSGIHRCGGVYRYLRLRLLYSSLPEFDVRASYDCAGVSQSVRIGS